MTTATPRLARTAPQPADERRPDLRIVTDVDEAPRRSASGVVGTLFVVLLFACIFGVVVFQVFLVQSQARLDELQGSLAEQESLSKVLDLETADLESPERIVSEAQALGMISPTDIIYLEPEAGDDARATRDPVAEPAPEPPPPAPAPAPAPEAPVAPVADPGVDVVPPATTAPTSVAPPATVAPGPSPSGPPYTPENNWGAGGPTTTVVYGPENNWGADLATSPAGTP